MSSGLPRAVDGGQQQHRPPAHRLHPSLAGLERTGDAGRAFQRLVVAGGPLVRPGWASLDPDGVAGLGA